MNTTATVRARGIVLAILDAERRRVEARIRVRAAEVESTRRYHAGLVEAAARGEATRSDPAAVGASLAAAESDLDRMRATALSIDLVVEEWR